MSTIPVVMSSSGAVPTSPVNILSALIGNVSATNPGYTANLPGTLIEDITSTDVAAIAQCDQARVDAINSVTPYGANAFVLAMLGAQFGISQGMPTNTSVFVIISGPSGYVIPVGFVVSDGTYTYIIQDGGVIGSGGNSLPLYCVASQSGTWVVPANSVTQIVTSVPSNYTLTVTNAIAGVPGTNAESVDSYRSRVIQAGMAMAQGLPNYLLTQLQAIPGVTHRLVSILQAPSGWEVICGGGDPVLVAGAIYRATLDLSTIVGSTTAARNVSATLIDSPNTYTITYVNPPQQVVLIAAHWNTNQPSFTASQSVNQMAAVALVNYINGMQVGQPINELEMTAAFQDAVASVLPAKYLVTLSFTVTINGLVVPPNAGTSIIPGDTESYFYCADNSVTVVQG